MRTLAIALQPAERVETRVIEPYFSYGYLKEEILHRRAERSAPGNQRHRNPIEMLKSQISKENQVVVSIRKHLRLVHQLALAIFNRFALLGDSEALRGVRAAAKTRHSRKRV